MDFSTIGLPALLRRRAEQDIALQNTIANGATKIDERVPNDVNPVWGIYRGSEKALEPDSFNTFEYDKAHRISNYPQELGGFAAFNKVEEPYRARVRMVKKGDELNVLLFLNQVEKLTASTELFSIVTPGATYLNANLVSFSYSRTAQNGVSMLTVDIEVNEVRSTAVSGMTKTVNPASKDPVNGGQVQPVPATVAQKAIVVAKQAVLKRLGASAAW